MASKGEEDLVSGVIGIGLVVILIIWLFDIGGSGASSPTECPNCGSTRGYYSEKEAFPSPIFHTRCKDCNAVK